MTAAPVLVTGGTGFLGGALLQRLRDADPAIPLRALVRNDTGRAAVRLAGAEPVTGDVLDPGSLRAAMEGCSVVFHVAGRNAMCLRDPDPLYRVNVTGSVNVVRAAAAAGVERLVYTSSAAVIGEERGTVATETSPHRGYFLSHYERSKYEAEHAVMAAARAAGPPVVLVNPSSVQGPGRRTGTGRLLVDFLRRPLLAAVDTRFSLVDIDDCSDGHLAAATLGTPGERYLLSGATLTVREAAALVAGLARKSPRMVYLPGPVASFAAGVAERIAQARGRDAPICREMVRVLRHGHAYDGSKAARDLGIRYRPVGATLARTVRWLAETGLV